MIERFGIFLAVLLVMLTWERLSPFRRYAQPRLQRFAINFGLMVLNFGCLRVLAGVGAVGVADYAAAEGWGLFNQVELPAWLETLAGMLMLDFAIYWQHRWFHRVPAFWRIHRVHHTDLGFDTSTAVRFHFAEIVLSMYYKMVLVGILGPSAATVLAFEAILNASALFNHGNVRLPVGVERVLRLVLITPDVHRIHHSSDFRETHTNFGFCITWWDRLCGSFRAEPALGQSGVNIGIDEYREPKALSFGRLLLLPFR